MNDLTILAYQQDVQPFKKLEDPTDSRFLSRSSQLVRNGCMHFFESLAQLVFSERVDQQRKAHHHQQSHQPFGFFQEQAVSKEEGIFQETEAPFF